MDNWFRELTDDRIEVCIKAAGLRLRASGPRKLVWPLVEEFEDLTGKRVEGEWRRSPRRGPRQIEGQLAIDSPSQE